MFQTFMPVQGEGGAPVSMSDTFSKLIVCLTAAARPSILCFCRGSRCWSGSTQRAAGARGFANQALMTCEAVCSQVPLRCVKTAFVTQGLGNRELVKNFCVPSLGHIREASARPCGQPHWSTRCLTLLMDWVMSNNPKVIRTFDACSRHSCRYREKGVPQFRCQTLSANWSYAWPPEPGHRFCVFWSFCWSGSTLSGLPVQEVSPTKRQWLVSLAVCSQVPLRCVKTAFVTQGLGNRELVKNFCVPSLGHIREASARPCGQPHWSTRCLTLLMDWVMSNNPKVIRTFDACSRHSCRYREKGVPQFRCQTLSANWSYAWPPQPGHRFCVFVEDSRCWSGSTQRAAGARGFANQTLMTCESGSL